ncbi:MAG: hypothetical protein Q4Q20_04725 [Methanocorpusculum sp.]|nr:hypothetical protein [Methanocorpusculum sp.]
MNDQERAYFKGKFRVLVIYIDIMLFAAALAIILGIVAPATWAPKIPVIIVSAAVAVLFLVLFIRKYRSTKAWLDVHGMTKAERLAKEKAEKEAERARIRAELEAELREEIEAERKAAEEKMPDTGAGCRGK